MKIDTDVLIFEQGVHRKLRVIVSIQAFNNKGKKIINENTLRCCAKRKA